MQGRICEHHSAIVNVINPLAQLFKGLKIAFCLRAYFTLSSSHQKCQEPFGSSFTIDYSQREFVRGSIFYCYTLCLFDRLDVLSVFLCPSWSLHYNTSLMAENISVSMQK